MLMTKYLSKPFDARARQVAALHHDRRVELPMDGRRHLDVAHAGKRLELRRRGIGVDHLARPCRAGAARKAMATCDPMASPSGRACEVMTKRCR